MDLGKPVVRFGIQEMGGTQAVIERGLKEVARHAAARQRGDAHRRRRCRELILGVKCGGSDGFSGLSANPALGRAADLLVRSGGTVLITEVPEFCGAEHILAQRAKDRATGEAVYQMVDWYKEYASKFGTVLEREPEPGQRRRRPAQHHDQVARRHRQGGHDARRRRHRVRASCRQGHGLWLMQGPGYDQESTPGLVGGRRAGRRVHDGPRHDDRQRHRAGREAHLQHAVFERMSRDLDLRRAASSTAPRRSTRSARACSSTCGASPRGEVLAKAEETKHREFGIWAEQSVSL